MQATGSRFCDRLKLNDIAYDASFLGARDSGMKGGHEEGSETDEQHRRGVVMGNGQFLPSSALLPPVVAIVILSLVLDLCIIFLLMSADLGAGRFFFSQPLKDFIFSRGGYHMVRGPSLLSSPFSVFRLPSLVFKTADCDSLHFDGPSANLTEVG
ncbi:hypothetical protein B0H13DRAFT_2545552 [Mycena leptocephala]|nr:hypothetical protein B0H13DRAFT_2545552 [Mycena leptocephala]